RQLGAGFYQIEIETKDKDGQPVKDVRYIELYDEKSDKLARPEYLWTGSNKTIVEPGEVAKIELGTGANDLFVVQQMDKSRIPNWLRVEEEFKFISINNEKKSFTFDAKEADRGGFGVSWMFIKHNRVYQVNQTINVPWSNKELNIEYATYRDKTLPGSE